MWGACIKVSAYGADRHGHKQQQNRQEGVGEGVWQVKRHKNELQQNCAKTPINLSKVEAQKQTKNTEKK